MPTTHEHEVVVLGAGPAGCAAALVLARTGHHVAVVRPTSTPHGELCESVPPSARKLLGELGVLSALERAGFQPNGGNVVWWTGRPAREEAFPEGEMGFHLDRCGLEDVLVRVAAAAGAKIYDATARSAEASEPEGWRVHCDAGSGGRLDLSAAWVLDATGRRGLLARREGRELDTDTATLCLLGRWRKGGGWGEATASHTLVESHRSGWAWSVPLGPEVRCFAAMVDHRHEALAGSDAQSMLAAELAKTEHIRSLLEDARPASAPWACPASLYRSARSARPGLLLVGDASSSIDPLSSYGVKKALSSGWLAGIVVRTALIDPALEAVALDFFGKREHEVYRRYRAASAPYFAEAAAVYDHPFWRTRAEAAARVAADTRGDDPDASEPDAVPEPRVRAAFEAIRARDRLAAAPGRTLRTLERPAIDGHRIVLDAHLASDAHAEGLRFVRSVDLRRVVELAPRHDDVAELWSAYNAAGLPVSLPDFLTALATTFAAGFLEHAPS